MIIHSPVSAATVLWAIVSGLAIAGCASSHVSTAEHQRFTSPKVTSANPLSQPRYPDESRRRGDQGLVGVDVFIEKDGRVTDAKIVMSSGHEALDASTLKEVFAWRFVPGQIDGRPAAMWNTYTVTFSLYDKRYPMPDQTAALAQFHKLIDQRKEEREATVSAP